MYCTDAYVLIPTIRQQLYPGKLIGLHTRENEQSFFERRVLDPAGVGEEWEGQEDESYLPRGWNLLGKKKTELYKLLLDIYQQVNLTNGV